MPFLGTTPTQGFVSSFPKQSFTADSSTTVFTLTNPVANANDLEVFVGNVRQEPTAAYSAAGTTLTMTEAVSSGLNFYVIFKNKAQVTTTPPVNSISTDKIVNNAVTVGKLATSGTLPALNGSALTHTGGLKSIQVFTSAGTATYTKPAGIRTVKVTVTGAGGQGGGYGAAHDYGAGGGAGGTSIALVDVSSISTVTVNVGAGGSGGSATQDGGAGSGSSFGSFCTGNGGGGGRQGNYGAVQGGQGGAATGGDINISGGMGENGVDNDYQPSGVNYRSAANGGASFWGGGGRGGAHNQGASAGMAFGTGGGAGSGSNSGVGGNGQTGIVYVEEYA